MLHSMLPAVKKACVTTLGPRSRTGYPGAPDKSPIVFRKAEKSSDTKEYFENQTTKEDRENAQKITDITFANGQYSKKMIEEFQRAVEAELVRERLATEAKEASKHKGREEEKHVAQTILNASKFEQDRTSQNDENRSVETKEVVEAETPGIGNIDDSKPNLSMFGQPTKYQSDNNVTQKEQNMERLDPDTKTYVKLLFTQLKMDTDYSSEYKGMTKFWATELKEAWATKGSKYKIPEYPEAVDHNQKKFEISPDDSKLVIAVYHELLEKKDETPIKPKENETDFFDEKTGKQQLFRYKWNLEGLKRSNVKNFTSNSSSKESDVTEKTELIGETKLTTNWIEPMNATNDTCLEGSKEKEILNGIVKGTRSDSPTITRKNIMGSIQGTSLSSSDRYCEATKSSNSIQQVSRRSYSEKKSVENENSIQSQSKAAQVSKPVVSSDPNWMFDSIELLNKTASSSPVTPTDEKIKLKKTKRPLKKNAYYPKPTELNLNKDSPQTTPSASEAAKNQQLSSNMQQQQNQQLSSNMQQQQVNVYQSGLTQPIPNSSWPPSVSWTTGDSSWIVNPNEKPNTTGSSFSTINPQVTPNQNPNTANQTAKRNQQEFNADQREIWAKSTKGYGLMTNVLETQNKNPNPSESQVKRFRQQELMSETGTYKTVAADKNIYKNKAFEAQNDTQDQSGQEFTLFNLQKTDSINYHNLLSKQGPQNYSGNYMKTTQEQIADFYKRNPKRVPKTTQEQIADYYKKGPKRGPKPNSER